jgi:geranylgeranyl reductase family protein
MRCDVMVVGGGPAGCIAAAAMASELEVRVVEEHPRIGVPVQCAGLVTPRVVEMASAEDTVINRVDGAYVHFPGGRTLELQGDEVKAVVVDRGEFDRCCASLAEKAGADITTGQKCRGVRRSAQGILASMEGGDMECKALLAADGYRSQIAGALGLPPARELVRGIEVDLRLRSEDQRRVRVFLGRKVAPGFFAWAIPCGDLTRVGLCVSRGNGAPLGYLNHLLSVQGWSEVERVRTYSGAIPLGYAERTYSDRVLVVGDAAGMAKPLSGGGIYTGLTAAEMAAETFKEAFRSGDMSVNALSRYERRWKEVLGSELRNSYLVRKVFVRMSDQDLDKVGARLDTPRAMEVISEGDIDHPTALAPRLIRACPSLMAVAPLLLLRLLRR